MKGVLGALLVLACACRSVRADGVPDPVAVSGLKVNEASIDRADFGLTLVVKNPHRWAGTLRAVTWELWLGGRWFATGTQELSGPLPGNGNLPLSLTLQTAFKRRGTSRGPDTVDARVRGNVRVDFPLGPEELTFGKSATVSTLGAPLAPEAEAL